MVVQAALILFGSFFVMLFAGVSISAELVSLPLFCNHERYGRNIFALTAAQRCFSGCDSFSFWLFRSFLWAATL